jgi:hypothetical protein
MLAMGEFNMVKSVGSSYGELADLLSYDPNTGEFRWKVSISSRAKAGDKAGVWQRMQNGKDYFSVTYKGRKMSGAQLAWLLHYKYWPDRSVFFVDGDTTNLRISNLKMADHKSHKVVGENGKARYLMSEEAVRHYGLQREYGISYTDYARMFASQKGVCAICNNPETAKVPGRNSEKNVGKIRDLSVDHDHKTGAIRGLLCNACNHLLGEAKDDRNILLSAVQYLDKYSAETPNVVSLSPRKDSPMAITENLKEAVNNE